MSTVQPIRAGGPLGARERTSAVWSIRHEIDEILEYFHDELDEWMSGREHHDVVLGDARAKLIGALQRVDALRALGPPSEAALRELLDEQVAADGPS